MLDEQGYRANVGIILANSSGKVLWARRVGQKNAWQFPQGGLQTGESIEQAMYRELYEEVGLLASDVKVLAQTQNWLHYRLPRYTEKKGSAKQFVGQKQKWFLLHLLESDQKICLNQHNKPEFDEWRWVNYWYPLDKVIAFKHGVYQKALQELATAHQGITSEHA